MKYLAFDLEIATGFPEEGDPDHGKLGISCAATLAVDRAERDDMDVVVLWHSRYAKRHKWHDRMTINECRVLARHIATMCGKGFPLLTWNGNFDLRVLAAECYDKAIYSMLQQLALGMIDPMFEMVCRYGFPVKLERAAQAMLDKEKIGMTGAEAPVIWRSGPEGQERVLKYVEGDVRLTGQLFEQIASSGKIAWYTGRGSYSEKPLQCLTVSECLNLPTPDTSWMSDPDFWAREKFVGWIDETV